MVPNCLLPLDNQFDCLEKTILELRTLEEEGQNLALIYLLNQVASLGNHRILVEHDPAYHNVALADAIHQIVYLFEDELLGYLAFVEEVLHSLN